MPTTNPITIGQRFGRWTVIGRASGNYHFMCRCECGTERRVFGSALKNGTTGSCGCLQRELIGARNKRDAKLGGASHREPEYQVWAQMRQRCNNPNDPWYSEYGARGIRICDRWNTSYLDFIADMGRRPSPTHSIDRIDNNENYEPSNCRWATKREQVCNRRPYQMTTRRGTKHLVIPR